MRHITVIGIILAVLGVLALAYQGITYTEEKTVLDVGPVKATAQDEETIPLPPIIGGALLVGGGVDDRIRRQTIEGMTSRERAR